MPALQRHRPAAALRLGRRAVPMAVAASLVLSGCTQGSPSGDAAPDRGAARPSSTSPRGTSGGPESPSAPTAAAPPTLPGAPSMERPAALANQLDLAAATLREEQSTPAALRRAGEFQQLAVRALATEPAAFRRKVTTSLDPETAAVTRAGVTAARVLGGMTTPQRTLPRWRIVAPPPPKTLVRHYREAEERSGVPWRYLAAIHLVETRMGRIRGTSTAGARGPMQFLPSTWELYGEGGDINHPRDAILAAARLLKANGAPRDMAGALWHYNPSDSYVRAVSLYARTIQRSESAYLGYWHWRVLYRHARGTYVLPVGYPETRPVLLPDG